MKIMKILVASTKELGLFPSTKPKLYWGGEGGWKTLKPRQLCHAGLLTLRGSHPRRKPDSLLGTNQCSE